MMHPPTRKVPSLVKIESTDRILDDFFKVDATTLRYERFDGSLSDTVRLLSLERGDAVGVVIVNLDRGTVVLTEQFRLPTYEKGPGWLLEIVAGMIDPGEDPEDTARRETMEETGYRIDEVEAIGTFYVSPGGSSERILLYVAEVATTDWVDPGGGAAAEGENIRAVELPLEDVYAGLDDGRFIDAKTLVGLMWLRHRYATWSPTAADA